MRVILPISLMLILFCSCGQQAANNKQAAPDTNAVSTYGSDRDFLKENVSIVELTDGQAKVLIVPQYQGRVMSSTCRGDSGFSFGWINYDHIKSKKYAPHINAYGGEERIWLGPEGGQFGLFFKKGDPFDIEHWQTPAIFDTVTFDLVSKQPGSAVFSKTFDIENYSGTKFNVNLKREIQLVSKEKAEAFLGITLAGVDGIGYQTTNTIKNAGNNTWEKSSGLLSVWLLGMMKSSSHGAVIIPYKNGGGSQVNDTYFGKIPANRLAKKDSVLIFQTDAKFRSKIGIPPAIVKPLFGSYDAVNNALTIIQFEYKGDTAYVNSMWEQQKNPYKGDVINAYNDGLNDAGKQLGQFYEMETSSPAAALKSKASLTHINRIFHFMGDKRALNTIALKLLGVNLEDI